MSISFQDLRQALKSTKYQVFRDKAKKNTPYPYIVYSFISEEQKRASGRIYKSLPLYQVSLFTADTEMDIEPLKKSLDEAGFSFAPFMSIQGDENDDTITNFFTQVRCINDGNGE